MGGYTIMAGDLTKNLSRHEFSCECGCGLICADFELVNVIQDVCNHFKCSVDISGPNRCREHNETVQKKHNPGYIPYSSTSKHMDGIAADCKFPSISPDDVADYLENKYPNKYGIGRYNNRIHIDIRSIKARWDRR